MQMCGGSFHLTVASKYLFTVEMRVTEVKTLAILKSKIDSVCRWNMPVQNLQVSTDIKIGRILFECLHF